MFLGLAYLLTGGVLWFLIPPGERFAAWTDRPAGFDELHLLWTAWVAGFSTFLLWWGGDDLPFLWRIVAHALKRFLFWWLVPAGAVLVTFAFVHDGAFEELEGSKVWGWLAGSEPVPTEDPEVSLLPGQDPRIVVPPPEDPVIQRVQPFAAIAWKLGAAALVAWYLLVSLVVGVLREHDLLWGEDDGETTVFDDTIVVSLRGRAEVRRE